MLNTFTTEVSLFLAAWRLVTFYLSIDYLRVGELIYDISKYEVIDIKKALLKITIKCKEQSLDKFKIFSSKIFLQKVVKRK